MKTIILSDLHIGDPRAVGSFPKIAELLNSDFDRLILNGDIFDLWLEDDPKVLGSFALTRKLAEVAQQKETYWIRGNHDHNADKVSSLLPNVPIVNNIELTEGGNKVLILHGHQVYAFENRAWYTKWLTRFNVWLSQTFDIDLQRKCQRTCYYENTVRKRRRQIIEDYGKGFNCVISGHTHLIGFAYYNGTELHDAGSTAFTDSYIRIENNHIYLSKI